MAHSAKGDYAYSTTENTLLEFFSKAGSLFSKRKFYYDEAKIDSILQLFRPAWKTDQIRAMKLSMWLRDCRGGSGNRSGFREILKWIAENHPNWINANLEIIPQVGRWDDFKALVGTPCEQNALEFWVKAIQEKNGLAAKWAPREKNNKPLYHKLRKIAKMTPKDFRKLLATNTKVIETAMCNDNWYDIEYNHVPSVAMVRSANSFMKHDGVRFEQWKASLADPDSKNKVNASVLFPHDLIRALKAEAGNQGGFNYSGNPKVKFYDSNLVNAQFAALPDYMVDTAQRIMPICDFSGSMNCSVSGSIQAVDVSMALGLYCSDRVGENNPFYRKFIPFSTTSKLVDWKEDTFSIATQKYNDGYDGSTNITAAFDQILNAAKLFNATNDQMPTMLLVLSDMQWDQGTNRESMTAVESCIEKWKKNGYKAPKIVYWNLSPYITSPATVNSPNIALVSGFSPALLTAILKGEDFSPMAILDRAIEKYEVVVPA